MLPPWIRCETRDCVLCRIMTHHTTAVGIKVLQLWHLNINSHIVRKRYLQLNLECLSELHKIYWWSVWFAYNLNHPSTKTCRRASQTLSICLNVKIVWVRWYEWYGQGTMWRSCKDAEWPHLPPARCRVPGKTLGNLQLGSSLLTLTQTSNTASTTKQW